jgi:CRP-like cAMP-binding protein
MRELTPAALRERFPTLFGGLDDTSTQRVLDRLSVLSFEDHATVLRRGEKSDSIYLIWAGGLEVVLHIQAEMVTLARREEGNWVGELSVLDPDKVTADVVATSPTTCLLQLTASDFDSLRAEDAVAGRAVLHGLVRDLSRRIRVSQEQAWRHEGGRWVLETAMQDREKGWASRLWTRFLGGEG